jgi:hypothetical protein
VNYAPASWLAYGRIASEYYRSIAKPTALSYQQLVINTATAITSQTRVRTSSGALAVVLVPELKFCREQELHIVRTCLWACVLVRTCACVCAHVLICAASADAWAWSATFVSNDSRGRISSVQLLQMQIRLFPLNGSLQLLSARCLCAARARDLHMCARRTTQVHFASTHSARARCNACFAHRYC